MPAGGRRSTLRPGVYNEGVRVLLFLLLVSGTALAGEAADFAEARLAAAEAEPLHRSEHLAAAIARLEKTETKDAPALRLLARLYVLVRRFDEAERVASTLADLEEPLARAAAGDVALAR